MAKLTGVKTIDMVNGEITKVEYNGEQYVKVDGEVGVGDIVLSNGVLDSACGNFYVTIRGKDGRRAINDDVGDYRDALDTFIVFRKQSAPTLTDRVASLEQRVDSLEGKVVEPTQETYRLVTDREPKAGDFVKFEINGEDIMAGKYYEIQENHGELYFLDDIGDKRYAPLKSDSRFADYREYFEKVSVGETITHNGAAYTLVDRKAQPGDVVVFTETGGLIFTNDTPYLVNSDGKVESACGEDFDVYRDHMNRTPANVKVYAPVALKVEPLKVGDYVIFTEAFCEHSIGKVAQIRCIDEKDNVFSHGFDDLKGNKSGWSNPKYFRKATDEEVTQAKAEASKQAEIAKWTAIGRRPNEYKKGDIVRVTVDGALGSRNMKEDIGEVTDVNSDGNPWVSVKARESSSNGARHSYRSIELITPVEARFDVTDRA